MMAVELDKDALDRACLKLARTVLWKMTGVSNDVAETVATRFAETALHHVDFIVSQQRDPNILTRAILYLDVAHAIPPMATDIRWFDSMLSCVMEFAVPNSGLSGESAAVLHDIRTGIAASLANARE
jgi:hypothetical protein